MTQAKTLLDMLSANGTAPRLSESALVIVDAQREYVDGNIRLANIDAALSELKKLLERARKLDVPVFHIVHHAHAGSPIFNPESEYAQIAEPVRPTGDEPTIIKHLPSSFVGTNLHELITASGKKNVVVGGFMTHMCIDATTRSALDLGYAPTIAASTCTTRDLPNPTGGVVQAKTLHDSCLAALADLVATVVPNVSDIPD
jgi:nicotinamidase-related amidase